MISLIEAQQLLIDSVSCLDSTLVPIELADGHIAAEPIVSAISVAPFRNSAMDGFAVSSYRLKNLPATLDISNTIFAGDKSGPETDHSKAAKIMTGAPVPDGYDTVVKFEDAEYDDQQVRFTIPIKPGQNIRLPGEDITLGETVIPKGQLIRPLDLGLLASIGLESVAVYRKPSLLILSTGDELAAAGQPLKFGQIYDSNSYSIEGMTRNFRASVDKSTAVSDSLDSLEKALGSNHDVIISTGGVSMGEKDFLPTVAEKSGFKTLFHKVSLKPGKPIFVATRGRQFLFGLPGNPLSAAVTCALFVLPALKKMIGIETTLPEMLEASLDESLSMKSGRTIVWPGHFKQSGDTLNVTLAGKRSSAALSALLGSDGLVYLFRKSIDDTPTVKAQRWETLLTP